MKISRASSSAILTILLLASGCGGRARTAPPPVKDVTTPRKVSAAKRPEKAKGVEENGVRLPGQDRSYPSEDPRNRPQSDSPALAPTSPAPPPSTLGGGRVDAPSAPAPRTPAVARVPSELSDFGPPLVPRGELRFRVQILASVAFNTALRARDELSKSIEAPVYLEREQEIWKVRVGDFPDRATADDVRRRLIGLGYDDAFVVEARGR